MYENADFLLNYHHVKPWNKKQINLLKSIIKVYFIHIHYVLCIIKLKK